MTTPSDLLISAIEEQRPIVLILGQDAWVDSANGDTLLSKALSRLGRDGHAQRGWPALLRTPPLPHEFYDWLAERFKRRVQPPSLEVLSELPWSAVFTSALDPTLRGLLEGQGREPGVVLTADETPPAVRSRARPPLYYLFSRAGEQDPKARPPVSRRELNSRRTAHAVPLLNRVLETATTLGLVVVDGFRSGRDWFRIEDLLGIIGDAAPNQVLWFGGRPRIRDEEADEFDEAVASERILVAPQRLGTLVAELRALDRLPSFTPPDSEDVGVITLRGGRRLETTPEERLRVEAVASIVDDSWTTFLPPLGKDAKYDTFRRFHGDLEGPRLLVEGIRRKFAIKRDFERKLLRQVSSAIAGHASIKTPIVVEGQSGTGKSVALARTVAYVREKKIAPVLYSIGRIPQPQEVSDFCESAEKAGAKATLIVCDTNSDVDQYHDLLMGLRSRGRRVVVLGSQYRDSPNVYNSANIIAAPTFLSNDEQHKLENLLDDYFDYQPGLALLANRHILPFLYRVLPASRPRIGAGLGAEARAAEQKIRSRSRQSRPVRPITQLHQQLIEKGWAPEEAPLFNERQAELLQQDGEDVAGRIIDLVMVAGSLNSPIPVNLLVRAVTKESQAVDLSPIADLFRDLDLFRWEPTDPEGRELLVTPRLPLEAQLICHRRLGGPESESNRLLDLIGAVRTGIDGRYEIQFLRDLLQQVGADGLRGQRYKHAYVAIARELTKLRRKYSVVDARLVLQESAFRRSAVRHNAVDDSEVLPLLEEARDAIQFALDGIADGSIRAARRTRQNLLVERAALYGFLANNHVSHGSSASEIWSSYEAARTAVDRAVSASDSYYPLDVGLWTPADLMESNQLPEFKRAELATDIYSRLDQVESDSLPPSQRERFYERQGKVGSVLQDYELTNNAYTELEKMGSTAGYFLRAREYVSQLRRDAIEISTHEDINGAKKAAEFLNERFNKIESDQRCLSLLLECRWISSTRRRLFRGERQPLPVDDATRRDALEVVRAMNQAAGEASRHVSRYLEAVLTWLVGDEQSAVQIFRDLAQETDYEFPGRVIRRHVITDADGKPRRFQGRIERGLGEGRWVIRVDQLNQRVDLLSRDFQYEDVSYGRTIKGFGIAFNFIGPIADPIRRR